MTKCSLIKINELIDVIDENAGNVKDIAALDSIIKSELDINLREYFTYLKDSKETDALNELIGVFEYYSIPLGNITGDITTTGFQNTINSNFLSSEVTDLFHTMNVARQYFESQLSGLVLTAISIGDKKATKFVNNKKDLNDNIKQMKEDLFQKLLEYTNQTNKDLKLYNENGSVNDDAYTKFKVAINLLESSLFTSEDKRESYNGRSIPNLRGSVLNSKDRLKFDAYNAAVILVNFDSVISKYFKNILKVDYSVFNKLNDSPDNAFKYSLNIKGAQELYWSKEDHESEGVQKLEDSLTKLLVKSIPQMDKKNRPTGGFLEMTDLYSIGGLFKEFEAKNITSFLKDSTWERFEENPLGMLPKYLSNIIEARKNNFLGDYSIYSTFSTKMEIVYSLENYISDFNILDKEKNSDNFSVIAILGQVINNTFGSSFQIYNTNGKYEIQEMYKHNASVIATQNSVYMNIANNLNDAKNWFDPSQQLETLFKGINLRKKLIHKNVDGSFRVEDSEELRNFKYQFKKFIYKRFKFNINSQIFDEIILGMDKSSGVNKGEYKLSNLKTDLTNLISLIYKEIIPEIEKNEEVASEGRRDEIKEYSEVLGDVLKNSLFKESVNQFTDSYITKTIMTIDTLKGDKIPTFRTASLMYNDISLLQSHYKNYYKNPQKFHKSLFFEDGADKSPVLLGTGTKLEIRSKDDSKGASKVSIIENFDSSLMYDFLKSFSKDKYDEDKSYAVTIGNYSDKTTVLTKFINVNAASKGKIIKDMTISELVELFRIQTSNYYTDVINDIFKQYSILFEINGKFSDFNKLKTKKTKINFINSYLGEVDKDGDSLFKKEKASAVFKGASFTEELHYSSYFTEKGSKRLALNQLIVDNYNIFSGDSQSEDFIKFMGIQEKSLIDKYLNANNENLSLNFKNKEEIQDYYKNLNLNNTQGEKQEIILEDGTLNPLVKKWMLMSNIFKNEYMYISAKGEYMHPHKTDLIYRGDKDKLNYEDLAIEMDGRLASMAKRNVLFTATIELPNRHLKRSVSKNVNIATIEDLNSQMYNISGKVKNNQDIHDGSSLINYIQSKLIENSYPGKGYVGTKKQFGTFINEHACVVKKDAETVLTNDLIRNSKHSESNFKYKQEQMLSAFNLDNFTTDNKSLNNIYLTENGTRKQLTSYVINNGIITLIYNDDYLNPVTKPVTNLYQIWEALGGEYTEDQNGNFTEASNDELFEIVVDNNLKEKLIHIISNKSSIKAGATNVNSKNNWKNNDRLMFSTFENRHMGPQLDAGHEADSSQIKEITQVISALAQNGNTAHLAQEIYENLAKTIKEAGEPYKEYLGSNTDDLYNYMSRRFIETVSKSDNASLAKNILESLPEGLRIPFSNQNFFQSFVRDVISGMNNEFITRYYRGIGAVLNPSHGIIKMFEDSTGKLIKQEDLAKAAFNDFQLNSIMYEPYSSNEEIIQQYLDKTYPSKEVLVNTIQPGDVIEFKDENNIKILHYLDTIEKYYDFKNKYKNQMVMKSFATARDLKPSEITFDIFDLENQLTSKNIFDTDSIRLRYTLNSIKDGKVDKTSDDYIILSNLVTSIFPKISMKSLDKAKNKKDLEASANFKTIDKYLNAWTQRNLQLLDNNVIMKSVNKDTLFKEYFEGDNLIEDIFEDVKHLYSENKVNTILNYKFKAAEIILPNIYKSDFETGMDSISTIQNDPNYFKKQIIDKFNEIPENDDSDLIISLGRGKSKIYVKYVSDLPTSNSKVSMTMDKEHGDDEVLEKEISTTTDRKSIGNKLKTVLIRLDNEGNKLYTIPDNSKVIVDKNGKETIYIKAANKQISSKNKEFYELDSNLDKTVHNLIKSFGNKIDTIIPTMNSSFQVYRESIDSEGKKSKVLTNSSIQRTTLNAFSNFTGIRLPKLQVYQPTLKNDFEKIKEKIVEQLAIKKRVSWEKSLEFVAARIPSQSMQSFMEMRNVAYHNNTAAGNDAYVSIWQIWLQGSK